MVRPNMLRGIFWFVLTALLPSHALAEHLPFEPSSSAIDILQYDVELAVSSLDRAELLATTRIEFRALEQLSRIRLHVEPRSVRIMSVSTGEDVALSWSIIPGQPNGHGLTGSRLEVVLPESVPGGQSAGIQIRYAISVQPENDPRGFFFDPDHHGSRILNTRNWPYFARYWLPSNDHPSDAARFRFTLHVPSGVRALANGQLVSTVLAADGDRHVFEQNEPIPTYALQVAIGELEGSFEDIVCFDPTTGTRTTCTPASARIPVKFFFPLMLPGQSSYVSEIERAGTALAYFSAAFGPYAFQESAFVNAPHPFNMESATLITLVQPGAAVHEVIHHWWGNAVQIETWGDFWISEGITTYFTGFFDEITTGVNTSCSIVGRPLDVTSEDPLDQFSSDPYCIGAAAVADYRERVARLSGLDPKDPEAIRGFLFVFRKIYERSAFAPLSTYEFMRELRGATVQMLCEQGRPVERAGVVSELDSWGQQWFTGVEAPKQSPRRRAVTRPFQCASLPALTIGDFDNSQFQ